MRNSVLAFWQWTVDEQLPVESGRHATQHTKLGKDSNDVVKCGLTSPPVLAIRIIIN